MQVTHSGREDWSLCRRGVCERGGSRFWDVYAISMVSVMAGSPCGRKGNKSCGRWIIKIMGAREDSTLR